jgi:phosphatidylglycerol:prolipoprotein diacylglycerol transferase
LLGRIANFINGELWGNYSNVKWAIIFPESDPTMPVEHVLPRHPSQLYEAGLEGALLLAWMQWRFWRSNVVRDQPGRLSAEFLIGYAIVRAIGEVFREPDRGVSPILGLSRGTFYSIFVFATGVVLLVRSIRASTPPSKQ